MSKYLYNEMQHEINDAYTLTHKSHVYTAINAIVQDEYTRYWFW